MKIEDEKNHECKTEQDDSLEKCSANEEVSEPVKEEKTEPKQDVTVTLKLLPEVEMPPKKDRKPLIIGAVLATVVVVVVVVVVSAVAVVKHKKRG